MNARLLLLPALLMLIAADAPKEDAAKGKGATDPKQKAVDEDNQALQGLWQVVRWEIGGHDTLKYKKKKDILFFEFRDGNKFGMRHEKKQPGDYDGYRLDPTKNPKEIHIKFGDEWAPAIYKLEGDFLTVVWGVGGDTEPPKGFKTERGDGLRLFKLKRLKE